MPLSRCPEGPCFDEALALDYATGGLTEARAESVEAHAETCDDCRRVLSELARALDRARSTEGPDPTRADDARAAPPASSPSPAGPRPGTSVGRYQVLRPLGAGAMGVVYLAYDPELDRNVALKLLADRVVGACGAGAAEATRSRAASLRAEAQAMAKAPRRDDHPRPPAALFFNATPTPYVFFLD